MYKKLKVEKTPKWARLLLSLKDVDDISIPDEVYELANQKSDSVLSLADEFNLNFSDTNFIQWLDDINYRTICITSDLNLTKLVQNLFLSVLLTNGKNIAVTCKNESNKEFLIKVITHLFKDDVVINLKSNKSNLEQYALRTDNKRYWFITPNPKFFIPERINEQPLLFDHHFIFTGCGLSTSYKFVNANFVSDDDLYLTGLTTEITRTTITLIFDDILDLYDYSKYSIFLSSVQKIFDSYNCIVESFSNSKDNFHQNKNSLSIDKIMTLVRSKKLSFKIQNLLKLGRVYFDEYFYQHGHFRFSDIELNHFVSKNKTEMYERYKYIENKILTEKSLTEYVSDSLSSDSSFGDLKTSQWYNLKNNSIFKQIFQNNLKGIKTLVLVNDEKIINNIKTTQSKVSIGFDNNANVCIIRSLSQFTDEIVAWTDNFIIAEVPKTKFEYRALLELEESLSLKFNIFVNLNTFEEEIIKQICPFST